MTHGRRNMLRETYRSLKFSTDRVELILDAEQRALDNIPENLRSGDHYDEREDIIAALQSALESMLEAVSEIESVL